MTTETLRVSPGLSQNGDYFCRAFDGSSGGMKGLPLIADEARRIVSRSPRLDLKFPLHSPQL